MYFSLNSLLFFFFHLLILNEGHVLRLSSQTSSSRRAEDEDGSALKAAGMKTNTRGRAGFTPVTHLLIKHFSASAAEDFA